MHSLCGGHVVNELNLYVYVKPVLHSVVGPSYLRRRVCTISTSVCKVYAKKSKYMSYLVYMQWDYTPRSTVVLTRLPIMARHSTMSAARTSLLLTPLFLQIALNTASTHNRKDTSKHRRRTMIRVGEFGSLRARNAASSRRNVIPRARGLRTKDHIPMSSKSHSGKSFLPAGLPLLPDPHIGELIPGIKEEFERWNWPALDSKTSMRSVSAAR
jgi:hypothetical protein